MSTPILDQIVIRAAAIEAFFHAVMDHGHAEISCDMEDYGREPGDIVTVTVGLDFTVSRTGIFTADLVQEASESVRQIWERMQP